MTNSEFWQDLEGQFRALDPHGLLRADGIYEIGSSNARGELVYQWDLRGETRLAVRFRVLAHKAGVALGRSALDPFVAWLQDLTKEYHYFRPDLTRTPIGEGRYAWKMPVPGSMIARIDQVCLASADHCASLHLEALEAEHLANSAPQPSRGSTVPQEAPQREPSQAVTSFEPSKTSGTPPEPQQPEFAPASANSQTRVPLHVELKNAEARTADLKLRNKLVAVLRYNHYFEDLKVLKRACKHYQTPALLEQDFRDLDVWAAMNGDDKADIAKGGFYPGIFAWSLVKRIIGLRGHHNRTLKNYRSALRKARLL